MKAILRQEFYNIRHVVAFIAVNLLFVNFLQAQGIPNITTKKQSKVVSLMLSHQQLDISFYLNNDIDFCSNAIQRVHPIGMDVKVFSQETIEEVDALTDDPCDREHVSLYIYENPDKYKIMHLPLSIAQEDIDHRLTLDTLEDKHLITTIFNELYPKNQDFRLENIINLLKNKPELDLLNTHIQQKIIR